MAEQGDRLPGMNTPQRHPAETGAGLAAAVALLLAHIFKLNDQGEIAALIVVVGAVPSAITWLVLLIRRRNGEAPAGGA
jgi:hypothetical protein